MGNRQTEGRVDAGVALDVLVVRGGAAGALLRLVELDPSSGSEGRVGGKGDEDGGELHFY